MRLFISYRRDDLAQLAFDVYKRLSEALGEGEVFLDTGSLLAGEDFRDVIRVRLTQCDAVIALIGKSWLSAVDGQGNLRLQRTDDVVRWELETALNSGVTVVPVLVDGTSMPTAVQLPTGIKALSGRNAVLMSSGPRLPESISVVLGELDKIARGTEVQRHSQHPERGYVLTFGGSNGEYTLSPNEQFCLGSKHSVISKPLYGGSGVNCSAKLMGFGISVLPVLNIGDDLLGREIRDSLIRVCSDARLPRKVTEWLMRSGFLMPNTRTPRSTIVVERHGRRTIFKESLPESERGDFLKHVEKSLDELVTLGLMDRVAAVVVGHIEADRMTASEVEEKHKHNRVPVAGPVTNLIVDRFFGQVPIFVNFGPSQIERGWQAWESLLPKIDVFQLNADELFRFSGSSRALEDIMKIDWLRRPMYSVITLDRFGALCIGSRMNGLIVTWSSKSQTPKDTTGAGDAFLSGVVCEVLESPGQLRRPLGILQPMSRGRIWAERTCQHYGGASETPGRVDLEEFEVRCGFEDPIVSDEHHARVILQVLGTAYARESVVC